MRWRHPENARARSQPCRSRSRVRQSSTSSPRTGSTDQERSGGLRPGGARNRRPSAVHRVRFSGLQSALTLPFSFCCAGLCRPGGPTARHRRGGALGIHQVLPGSWLLSTPRRALPDFTGTSLPHMRNDRHPGRQRVLTHSAADGYCIEAIEPDSFGAGFEPATH